MGPKSASISISSPTAAALNAVGGAVVGGTVIGVASMALTTMGGAVAGGAVASGAVASGAVAGGSTAPAAAWEREKNGPEVKRGSMEGQRGVGRPPAGVRAEHWVHACMGELGERTRIGAVAPAAAGAQVPSPGVATVP